VVNAIDRMAPQAAIAFNARPEDSHEAARAGYDALSRLAPLGDRGKRATIAVPLILAALIAVGSLLSFVSTLYLLNESQEHLA